MLIEISSDGIHSDEFGRVEKLMEEGIGIVTTSLIFWNRLSSINFLVENQLNDKCNKYKITYNTIPSYNWLTDS